MEHQLAQFLSDPKNLADLAKGIFEAGSAFIGFMTGIFIIWRKVNKAITKYTTQVDEMAKAFIEVVQAQSILAEKQTKLTEALGLFGSKIEHREKDTIRLEGALDATRKDMLQLIGSVREVSGSLDGLWRTLQTLHPTQVPKRASDRG